MKENLLISTPFLSCCAHHSSPLLSHMVDDFRSSLGSDVLWDTNTSSLLNPLDSILKCFLITVCFSLHGFTNEVWKLHNNIPVSLLAQRAVVCSSTMLPVIPDLIYTQTYMIYGIHRVWTKKISNSQPLENC